MAAVHCRINHRCRHRGLPAVLCGSALAAAAWLPLQGAVAASDGPQATAPAEQAIRARYRCLGRFDAVDVTALFFNRPPAELVLLVGETATRLPQVLAAGGARYAAADQEFWIRGDQARWTLGRARPMACQVTGAPIPR